MAAAPFTMPSVNPLEEAVGTLADFLDGHDIPYMVIGGIAGLVWGLRRATFDVDVTLWAGERERETVTLLTKAFPSRAPDPAAFVRDTSVLPVTVGGIPADVVFGRLPYERAALARSRTVALGGCKVRVCTLEDLILHKIISKRAKDLEDVRELIRLRVSSLDRKYLEPRVRALAEELAEPAILEHYLRSLS